MKRYSLVFIFEVFLILTLIFSFMGPVQSKSFPPLKIEWNFPAKVDDIYSFNLDKEGQEEIYACSYEISGGRYHVYVLNTKGDLLRSLKIPKYSVRSKYKNSKEWIKLILPTDLDKDKNLDVVAFSDIRGQSVNVQKIYRAERNFNQYLQKYEIKLLWTPRGFTVGNMITSFGLRNNEILAGCKDGNIYLLTPEGKLKGKILVDSQQRGSVWDIKIKDVDQDGNQELIAGGFFGIALIEGKSVTWKKNIEEIVKEVEIGKIGGQNRVWGVTENSLYSLNLEGGIEWKREIGDIQTLTIGKVTQDKENRIVVGTDKKIMGFNREGGKEWEFGFSESLPVSDSILSVHLIKIGEENFLLAGGYNSIYGLKVNSLFAKNKRGLEAYQKALDALGDKKYEKAERLSKEALALFQQLNDTQMIQRANKLTANLSRWANKIREADQYYQEAKNSLKNATQLLEAGNYQNIKNYLNESSQAIEISENIYYQLDYKEGMREIDNLSLKLENLREELKNKRNARAANYLIEARESYEKKNYENAIEKAQQALQIYRELGRKERINVSLSFIQKANRSRKAWDNYAKAKESLDERNYQKAKEKGKKCEKLYRGLNSTLAKECKEMENKADEYLKAKDHFQQAKKLFEKENYTGAKNYLEKANDTYVELGDNKSLEKVKNLSSRIEDRMGGSSFFRLLYIVPAVFLIILIAVGVWWWRKKSSATTRKTSERSKEKDEMEEVKEFERLEREVEEMRAKEDVKASKKNKGIKEKGEEGDIESLEEEVEDLRRRLAQKEREEEENE